MVQTVQTFKVGDATITRVEETFLACYPLLKIFPDFTDAHMAVHEHWLAPNHYEPETGQIMMSVHSWLLQVGGKKILIDGCCGNNKLKPGRPFWNMLNEPYLERLAAAGARPDEIDIVMCTHLHHDHVGWNTMQKDGKWVPTFPNARYVFSKPDVDYFSAIDADPKEGPAELGTFRECVVPILEYGKADLVDCGPYRLNDFIEIELGARPFARSCVFQTREQRRARCLYRRRLASSVAGLRAGLEFPEEFRPGRGARQPPQGAGLLCRDWCAGDARPCWRALRRPHRGGAEWIQGEILRSIPSPRRSSPKHSARRRRRRE